MKGIVLAGGAGTRLYPLTIAVSKQLLPVYDKPMIYYPISVLMLAGIRQILIITTPEDQDSFKKLLGDGTALGCEFQYEIQAAPNGLAEAFIIGEKFIGDDKVALVLGDNIFYGNGLSKLLQSKTSIDGGAIFAYPVRDPERFGVVTFDENNKATSIEEKPESPQSNYAVPGLYFYDNDVVEIAKSITPSARGEKEITAINQVYLSQGRLEVVVMSRGMSWFDTGTVDALDDATEFIRVLQRNQSTMISCLEEIAYKMSWITYDMLKGSAVRYGKGSYATYINTL
ncbi:glucose-1-phosphate thymidylyltransferase RfbA [uncultured Dokdonia sp.]|uniref:glucose-1-phosphate thymidylyltransferase RfbA n=1 Tax=uncultured Dokdonia sp. TaxID=575653 RepID=UPI002620E110|nr:glucose-1-phosphate thymidylyltransferase RfbA [uncultured Dokdonia sp.]